MLEPVAASRGDDEHPEAVRIAAVLEFVVQSNLPLPTVAVPLGTHALGPVIQFDEEIVLLPGGVDEFEGAVREESLIMYGKTQTVFRVEVPHADAVSFRGDERMDDELGERVGVMMAGHADFAKGAFPGRGCSGVVEEPVREEGGLVVLRCPALAGGRVAPPTHPAGGVEFLEPVLDAAGTFERRLFERLAKLHELPHRQRTTVQREQGLRVTIGKLASVGTVCHGQPQSVASGASPRLFFPLHGQGNASIR